MGPEGQEPARTWGGEAEIEMTLMTVMMTVITVVNIRLILSAIHHSKHMAYICYLPSKIPLGVGTITVMPILQMRKLGLRVQIACPRATKAINDREHEI